MNVLHVKYGILRGDSLIFECPGSVFLIWDTQTACFKVNIFIQQEIGLEWWSLLYQLKSSL